MFDIDELTDVLAKEIIENKALHLSVIDAIFNELLNPVMELSESELIDYEAKVVEKLKKHKKLRYFGQGTYPMQNTNGYYVDLEDPVFADAKYKTLFDIVHDKDDTEIEFSFD